MQGSVGEDENFIMYSEFHYESMQRIGKREVGSICSYD